LIPRNTLGIDYLNAPNIFAKIYQKKIERYTTTEWWVPAVAHQAVRMLCILKKNGTLRTVFNL
jgi:hypothetical protein